MIHYNYSAHQLENEAEKLLTQFDPERLKKPKPIDVYAVIEKCLGVDYDWKYITPDQSILGATAFNAGYVWVWPEPCYREGMLPSKLYLSKGSILIDATLTEGDNRGRENFTVMHEVFHQVLHKNCFRRDPPRLYSQYNAGSIKREKKSENIAGFYRVSGECVCSGVLDAAECGSRRVQKAKQQLRLKIPTSV